MKIASSILAGALALAPAALAQTAGVESPQGGLLRGAGGAFYGTSDAGGANGNGTVFRVTPESEVTVLADFAGDAGAPLGAHPRAGFVDDGTGTLWSTTEQGGANGLGTVFKYSPATGTLATVVEFAGANGAFPAAALVSDGAGTLWGTTRIGGANDFGTVFTVDVATGALTTIAEFTGTSGAVEGAEPKAALVFAAGKWWGTTSGGGASGLGTVFSIDPANANTFATAASFTGTNGAALGSAPEAALIPAANGRLWGTTSTGGTSDLGTVFQLDPAAPSVATVVNFTGANGANPRAALREEGAELWGTTSRGGSDDLGTIFKITTPGNTHGVVASFNGTSGAVHGAYPLAALAPGAPGELWGAASKGGSDDRGAIFKVLTATGAVVLIAEPELAPVLPSATVQAPPAAVTTGAAGTPVALRGTAKDNIQLLSVVVSINGGPFLPATIAPPVLPKKPFTWQIDVVPENGVNVVVIKSVDNGGNPAKPVTLVFNYTVTRPELAGGYSGLLTAAPASLAPLRHTGAVSLKVTAKGRFTGSLRLGGIAKPLPLTGSIGNAGTARFGKTGAPALTIARKNLPPLLLALNFDVTAPVSGVVGGTLREAGATVAAFDGSLTPRFNPKTNPVPAAFRDPATDKGAYTTLLAARTPAAQGLAADLFPQGDGTGKLTISPTGGIKFAGKLADGTAFSAAGPLRQEGSLSLFASLYKSAGAISARVDFVETVNVSDANAAVQWFRPALPLAPLYRGGWPGGIAVDLIGSKYIAPAITGKTPLGNAPSGGNANGLVKLRDGNLPAELSHLLAIPLAGPSINLGAPPGGLPAASLNITLLSSGLFSGSFAHPASPLLTAFSGVVLQKTQTGGGFFFAVPRGGQSGDQSGHVELSAQ